MSKPPTAADLQRLQADLQAAITLHQQGDLDGAEAAYIKILERAPSQPDALNLLGVIHSERNRNEAAVDLIGRAARLRPKDGAILNNFGRACLRTRRFEQAIEALERAIALAPDVVESYGNIVQAHRAAGNVAEATYYIETLRRLRGGSITADYEQARLYSDLGDKPQARALFEKLTHEHPGFAPPWHALARLDPVKPGDPLIDGILAAIEEAPAASAALRLLCYAAGKAFDDLGDYDRAFDFVLRAKQQDAFTYDPARVQANFDALTNTFDDAFFAARRDYGVDDETPLFIVGMPRSGTTLAEQMLASHPDVHGAGELEYASQITYRAIDYIRTGRFPEAAATLSGDTIAAFAFQYLRKIRPLDPRALRITDKMPHNFQALGLLRLMFTRLRVVHCLRHPYDTCLSCFTHDFAHHHTYNQSLEAIGDYYARYRVFMEHWEALLGDAMLTLQYESVVADQPGQSRRLVEFAGLDWDDRVLSFSETQRRVATPSAWQVRQPIFSTSKGRWKHYAHRLLPALEAIPARFLPTE
ncbi:MAG: tetratricopeptide repeat protein [Alphaproteobacteria bacterium]|nr:tetratricopeptide repeat protein [Alphaproteobacteria bacterium]